MTTAEGPGPRVTPASVEAWLVRCVAEQLDVPVSEVSPDTHVMDLDIDSVSAVMIARQVERWYGAGLPEDFWRHPTLRDLSRELAAGYVRPAWD